MKSDFIKALSSKQANKNIIAYFKDGEQASYTMAIYNLLITDKDTQTIIDADTGEILFTR